MSKLTTATFVAVALAGFFVGNANAETSCTAYWSDANGKRWYPNGFNNNDWIKHCKDKGDPKFNWVDSTWLAGRTAGQYVVCLKYEDSTGMGNHVFEPEYTTPAITYPSCEGVKFAGVVYKDCLAPSTLIKANGKYIPISSAATVGVRTVTTLKRAPGLSAANVLNETSVRQFVSTPIDGNILKLMLGNGSSIAVTGNHPMVLADGQVVKADMLRVGDGLLRVDGDLEPILSIRQEAYIGDVWNVQTTSEKKWENMIMVNDVVVGSMQTTDAWAAEETRLIRASAMDVSGL